jgi:hypothetical protein
MDEIIRIAVCGHRQLDESPAMANLVKAACNEIKASYPARQYMIYSCLAEGADRILTERLTQSLPGGLVVVLPLPEEEYLKDFTTDHSKREFQKLKMSAKEILGVEGNPLRPEAYRLANRILLDEADLVVAAWSGQEPEGPGGTGETVSEARLMGLPLLWIHTIDIDECLLTVERWNMPQKQDFLPKKRNFPVDYDKEKTKPTQRLHRFFYDFRWMIIGMAWVLALGIGLLGFYRLSVDNDLGYSVGDLVYLTLQLVGMGSGMAEGTTNWALEISRFLIPALAAYTLLQAMATVFKEQWDGLWLRRIRGHLIVSGEGEGCRTLVRGLLQGGHKVALLRPDTIDPLPKELKKAIIVRDAGFGSESLLRAGIKRAACLICFDEKDEINLSQAVCAFKTAATFKTGDGCLSCLVHLDSPELYNLVKKSEMSVQPEGRFQLELFNPYARAARQMLMENRGWAKTLTGKNRDTHLLIAGTGKFAMNLIWESAIQWEIANQSGLLAVTVLGEDAKKATADLQRQHPDLGKTMDLRPEDEDFSVPGNLPHRLADIAGRLPVDHVAICMDDSVSGLQLTLALLSLKEYSHLTINVWNALEGSLLDLLKGTAMGSGEESRIVPFDLYEKTCTPEQILGGMHQQIAEGLHNNYLNALSGTEQRIPWENLSEEEKEANRSQARRIHHLFRTAGLRILPIQQLSKLGEELTEGELLLMAQEEHELWREGKESQGWMLGSERSYGRKTHPDLVPWNQLPLSERAKNIQYVKALPCLLAGFGYQFERFPELSEAKKEEDCHGT